LFDDVLAGFRQGKLVEKFANLTVRSEILDFDVVGLVVKSFLPFKVLYNHLQRSYESLWPPMRGLLGVASCARPLRICIPPHPISSGKVDLAVVATEATSRRFIISFEAGCPW
jgi:hypothetical protein